jgi:hypothetical protein
MFASMAFRDEGNPPVGLIRVDWNCRKVARYGQ